ncbi:MAG: SRPBCC family protein [Deltaproteobacteria bacterium]|nr:SRPBCC family protein [Deltaproteobacteria bacterium]MBW2392699.1 SRPBCC family protein [Deltaproteobacteria bacterium]
MSIQIEETFQVAVPIEAVWQFLLDPHRVVTCMPGAVLEEVVDARTFNGAVKIKLGAITTRYRGRVHLRDVDEQARRVCMVAEGRETGGGTAKGTVTAELRTLPDGQTEVVTSAEVDLTGRVMQVGRGMIQGVSSQLFGQFVTRTRQALEAPASDTLSEAPVADESVPLLRVILGVIWAPVAAFFHRLFARQTG